MKYSTSRQASDWLLVFPKMFEKNYSFEVPLIHFIDLALDLLYLRRAVLFDPFFDPTAPLEADVLSPSVASLAVVFSPVKALARSVKGLGWSSGFHRVERSSDDEPENKQVAPMLL